MTYSQFPVAAGDIDPEDAKIVRLARVAQQRAYVPVSGAGQGAAIRDVDGRTYSAATVEHSDGTLTISAIQGALSAALSSGARQFAALVVVPAEPGGLDSRDRALIDELSAGIPVLFADVTGSLVGIALT